MSKQLVTLRRAGNSVVLTAPADLKDSIGTKYQVVRKSNGEIVYTPLKHHNIFDDPDWQNYDYQADIANDPALQID